jgi:hypothetical protein
MNTPNILSETPRDEKVTLFRAELRAIIKAQVTDRPLAVMPYAPYGDPATTVCDTICAVVPGRRNEITQDTISSSAIRERRVAGFLCTPALAGSLRCTGVLHGPVEWFHNLFRAHWPYLR